MTGVTVGRVEFGILGPLAVWTDGRELPLGAPKQRAVLALLLLRRNELVPTATLVDLLWAERPPATAVKAVQVYVSQLRKALGDETVETRPLGYALRAAPGALDAVTFEELLARGRALLDGGDAAEASAVLRRALGLWRGPALADFRYEAFARDETGRLEELRFVALEQRLEADLALGRHAEAVPELEALVREHPLRESLRGLLMLALYRSGRQADALAAYQDARTALVDELGLDPGQALQRLEGAILRQDPSLDLAAVSPPPPSPPREPVARTRPSPAADVICATCGAANSRGAQFCQSCGAGLRPQPAAETRKTVTLLFCDVLDYGELAARLDAEALRQAMSRFFELAAATIERHGGTVETFVGDEVTAVFGVPVVREDDALRAVRAALELRDGVTDLEVRIAITTGEVIAGAPGGGHGFVTGEAVALGRRLQRGAKAGEVVLGEKTHALVAHAVTVSPLDGGDAYRLDALDPAATAVPRRADAPLIGRERELDWVRGVFAEVAGGHGARQVVVVGEAGVGKSRFGREFVGEVGDAATVLIGRCPPYGEGITFWPLRELLVQAGRDPDALTGSSHEIFAAARRVLVELAAERPLVAAFDDLHWAEPTFLDFVEYLAARLGDAPVLLLCLGRPELVDRRPGWLRPPAESLALEPLSDADSERLLEALGVEPGVRPRIAEAAEGNPLFVEQLAAIAGEYGAGGPMPVSIRGVLHERLDRLDRSDRALLERAAVAGRSFTLEDVFDLTRPEDRDDVQARLLGLVRTHFVRPDPAAPDEGFRFHHALIRDAAYDGIPKSTRADLHERVAARLDVQSAADAVVGYHLEQAFLLRSELGGPDAELGARAGRLLRAAGLEAFAASDLPATVTLLRRARPLLPPAEAPGLLPKLGQALFEAGRFAEAEVVLTEAAATDDPVLASRARVEQQFLRLQTGGAAIDDTREVATAALAVFEQHGDDVGRCRAWSLLASIEWTEGHATDADEAWRRAAVHARVCGEDRELYEILGWRAAAAVEGPTPVDEGIRTCDEIREQVRASPVAVADILHPLAALHAMRGEHDEARALIREGNAIRDELDRMQSAVSHHEALVEMLAGNPAEAAEQLRRGYERLEQMGERATLATTAAMLAQALYALERYREAERLCTVSRKAAAPDDLSTQVIWRGVRAKLLARRGKTAEAEELAREALALAQRTDLLTRQADLLLDLADVLRASGRVDDADAAVAEALDRYVAKGNTVGAGRARLLVAVDAR
jgi:DNA-binding SARP family transcriptional activator/class 3 adenylate cyclase